VPDFEFVAVDLTPPVGALTLARPDKLNALSPALLRELAAAARAFDERDDIAVVVVRGEGRAFSAGFDLAYVADRDSDSPALGRAMSDAIASMRALTIAAVPGHCVGGGVVLAAACDLRVAADDAVFSIPEVDLGIPLTWGGIPLLVRAIGAAATLDLVLTCRQFDANEAARLRFVQRVVPAAQLRAMVEDFAHQLARKPSLVVRQTKAQVAAAAVGEAVDEAALMAAALSDAEARDAARRYLDARRGTSR
jgi:enoyl-CoA hydratase/carnithine racemase